ncbi:MAG: hypothetical protein KQI35_16295 [Bacteroidetes bacterium]|nr:hypothetical protein [Bacteroidota bacterium]
MKNLSKFTILICVLFLSVHLSAQPNTALDFNERDRVDIPNYEMVGFTGLTVEAWIKLNKYQSLGSYTGSPAVMQKTDPAITAYNDYGIILMVLCLNHEEGHDKQLAFGLNFRSDGYYHIGLHSGDTIRLNEWHHIAGTWDGTSMYVYIDGVLVNSFNVVDSIGNEPFYSPDYGLYMGYKDEGQYGYFDGQLDEVRIWNYSRSEVQLRSTMYQELTGSETGLHAYWNFNETSGETVYDQGPNGFDGFLGSAVGYDIREPDRVTTTAPIPYYTAMDGNYDSSWVWATGQDAPLNDWAQINIKHDVNLAADETVKNLTISNSGALTIDNGYTLTVSGEMLIESDATGTGSFIDNGTLSYSSATVERYLSENRWHYVSSPVENATAGVFTSIYLRSWDEPTETWSYITNVNAGLNEMEGYAAWASSAYTGDATVTFTGALNSGNFSMSLTNTAGTSAPPNEDPSGYNFIGNPYPSGIDWDNANWTKSDVDDAIYIITYINGNRQYASYIDGVSTHGATNEIAPHQGFFVKCNSTSGGNIQVTNDTRIHTGQAFFKNTLNQDQLIKLKVINAEGLYDETVIRAKENATTGFDGNMDALKLKGGEEIPQLYTRFDDQTIYSINTIDHIGPQTVIPVSFEAGGDGIFELSFKMKDGLLGLPIYLEDTREGIVYNLKDSGSYKFTGAADDDPERFILRFSTDDLKLDPTGASADALVYAKNDQVMIHLLESLHGDAMIYDLSGKLVAQGHLEKGANAIKVNTNPGYLLVKIVTPERLSTEKIFIK